MSVADSFLPPFSIGLYPSMVGYQRSGSMSGTPRGSLTKPKVNFYQGLGLFCGIGGFWILGSVYTNRTWMIGHGKIEGGY